METETKALVMKVWHCNDIFNPVFLKTCSDPCSIPLEPVFMEGNLPPTVYNVVKDGEFRGEIRVGLTFTPEVIFIA